MKKKIFSVVICLLFVLIGSFALSGCGVVSCAWVSLDVEGYVYYSSNMYSSGGEHIYLYESKEVAEANSNDYMLTITFYPRSMGADNFVDGKNTTIVVDVSKGYSMNVYIYKNKSVFGDSKRIYLNGVELTPSYTYDSDVLRNYTFENFGLVRGNPNGQENGFINSIEYK